MFSFFKKKDSKKNYGTFSAYGMEDLYHFLSDEKILDKQKDLKGIPTLGTSFNDFVLKDMVKSPSGEFHFFNMLLWYFQNDLDLALHLYNKSKDYSESNYPKKDSLKLIWNAHLEVMDRLIKKSSGDNEIYISEKRPLFWFEYNLLYTEIIKNLIYNFNLQVFFSLQISGEFKRKGSRIANSEIEIIYRSKNKPQIGYYLIFKSDLLLRDIKRDLIEVKKDVYTFQTLFGSYEIELKKESARISNVSSFSNQKIELIKSTNFNLVLKELINNYSQNFDKISERHTKEIRHIGFNLFLFEALKIKKYSPGIQSTIESKINSKGELWGRLDDYFKDQAR
jgi:hypothetical protein